MYLGNVTLQGLLPMIRQLPEIERRKLRQLLEEEVISQEAIKDKLDNWRKKYIAKIQSNSIWSDDMVSRIEQAGKELNQFHKAIR